MAYFSNGTEGEIYYEHYCSRCVHESDGRTCSIWLAHLIHNYDECNNPKSILHTLIPRKNEGLSNGECTMFIPASAPK